MCILHYPKNLRGLDTLLQCFSLVYFPYDSDHNCLCSCDLEMVHLDSSSFKRNFKVA